MSRSRYVRIPVDLPDDPFVARLCRHLGDHAFRCVMRLFLWRATHCPGRIVMAVDPIDIAAIARWPGHPEAFSNDLLDIGILVQIEDGWDLQTWAECEATLATLEAEAKQGSSKAQARGKQRASTRQAEGKVGSGVQEVN